jgi:phosphoribosylamine--glycine ligase
VVLAAEGYPAAPKKGDVIHGLGEAAQLQNVTIFHAGTSPGPNGGYLTAGGRVLGITATGENISKALKTVYEAVILVQWEGMQYRRDIGK